MKPYLMLLLAAISLAAVKPVRAQKNKINCNLPVPVALKDSQMKVHADGDSGVISLRIDWASASPYCGFSTVNIIPASNPNGAPLASQQINTMGYCFSSVAFRGPWAGIDVIAEVICSTGLRAQSAPGYVHSGWDPLILSVAFPK